MKKSFKTRVAALSLLLVMAVQSIAFAAPGDWYNSADDAAKAWTNQYNAVSINVNKEYGSAIYYRPSTGKYTYATANVGSYDSVYIGMTYPGEIWGDQLYSDIHTHQQYSILNAISVFSEADIKTASRTSSRTGYLATSKGELFKATTKEGATSFRDWWALNPNKNFTKVKVATGFKHYRWNRFTCFFKRCSNCA